MNFSARHLFRSAKRAAAKRVYVDRVPLSRTVVILGAGRSGTTWIAEEIVRDRRMRYVFEPFHAGKTKAWRGQSLHQYVRPNDRVPPCLEAASRILAGRVSGHWPDHFNGTLLPHHRLIKDVRANLMAAWLHRQFPEVKMVLVVRHPCGVIRSRTSLSWQPMLGGFLDQPQLMADHLQPFQSELRAAGGSFEQQLLRWCIEHYVPLRQLDRSMPIYFYEDFCVRPEKTFGSLCEHFGLRAEPGRFDCATSRPSKLVRAQSAVLDSGRSGESIARSWAGTFTAAELAHVGETLRRWKLDTLFTRDGMPASGGVEVTAAALRMTQP